MRSQELLDRGPTRAASDAMLGALLVATGAVALAFGGDAEFARSARLGPWFFPRTTALLMLLTGVALWLRARLLRGQPQVRWSAGGAALLAALVAAGLAAWWWSEDYAPRFDPPEWTAILMLILAVMVALSRLSRLRAAGLVLLGLLLGLVGTHINTGVQRLMFGFESLADGLSLRAALIGFVIADAALCAATPSLFLASYARKFGLRPPSIARASPLHFAGAIVIAAGIHAADAFADVDLIGQLALFTIFGLACHVLDWNRLVFLAALTIAPLLEETFARAVLLAQGDPAFLWSRPIATGIVLAAIATLTIAIALSAWRSIRARQLTG